MHGRLIAEIEDEVRGVVTFVEEMTGLRSRWNGTGQVINVATAALLAPSSFLAKKEWGCGITLGNNGQP